MGTSITSFEKVFQIKPGHTLREVSSHLGNYDDDWKHEECDAEGVVVATYKSWDYMPPRGTHSAGWRKFSPDGTVLEEHDELPI